MGRPAGDSAQPNTLLAGLRFPECPRWHDGSLWVSDMWGKVVYRIDGDGHPHPAARLPDPEDEPGGIAFTAIGEMLVVGMFSRTLFRFRDGEVVGQHDLSDHVPFVANDLTVDSRGNAYVTQVGRDLRTTNLADLERTGQNPHRPLPIVCVDTAGTVRPASPPLLGPNGIVLSEDERYVYVAEPGRRRTVRFTLDAATLTEPTVVASVEPLPGSPHAGPDGICLDERGNIWWTDPMGRRLLHVDPTGQVLGRMAFDAHPTAVVLGGPDRRTLFITMAGNVERSVRCDEHSGRIDSVRVEVAGAGVP